MHSSRCHQCGKSLSVATDRVAAHVVAYPCVNGILGCMTLRSTCKRCNSGRGRHWYCRIESVWTWIRGKRLAGFVCYPCCFPYLDPRSPKKSLCGRREEPTSHPVLVKEEGELRPRRKTSSTSPG